MSNAILCDRHTGEAHPPRCRDCENQPRDIAALPLMELTPAERDYLELGKPLAKESR